MEDKDKYDYFTQRINELEALINKNVDNITKEIGDRVKIWDGSGNKDKHTGKKRWGVDELFENNSAIVIETNCEVYSDVKWYEVGFTSPHLLDLLVHFPNGTQVYVSSRFVKIV